MIRKFFIGAGKAACYFGLYFLTQVIAAYMVMAALAVKILLGESALPDLSDADGFARLAGRLSEEAAGQMPLILLISAVLFVGSLALIFHMRGRRLSQEVWLGRVQAASLWPVAVLGAALAFVIGIAITYIPWPERLINSYNDLYGMTGDEGLLAVAVTVLVAPIIEELTFRGLIFTRLCTGMPAPAALILTSTVFGAMHGTLIWAAYGFVGGVAMTLVFMKYRSLAAPILLHCVFNIFGGYIIWRIPTESARLDLLIFAAAAAVLTAAGVYIRRMPRSSIDPRPRSTQP